jgi:hypothetical protein
MDNHSGMFNRVPRKGFAWRLHLLRDVASSAPANGAASILSACSPCEGWTRLSQASSENCLNADSASLPKSQLHNQTHRPG